MYYRKRYTQKIDPMIGGILNAQNVEKTLAMDDITQAGEVRNDDFALMQEMYPQTAKKLLPYVKKSVGENIYDGSPVLRDIGPDRSCIGKMTLSALDMAANAYDGAEEICLENKTEDWSSGRLLHDLTETMVLAEVFLAKRNGNN
ncbi:MAG: hypothetical protein IJR45_03355 [Firmicutes bacterium]|nr:hypothetical protein [Bacillota bacterium]MBQ9604431.1 hypothetical protein [Bacillota bacterium]